MSGYTPEGLDDAFSVTTPEQPAVARGSDAEGIRLPSLGPLGWARWVWRQLTSMRLALLLLMALAVAAVPGSVFPQRPVDAAAVARYVADHPGTAPWLDRAGFFDVYASPWFSAIYLLLFVSLVGCILPRARAHWRNLRTRPPRTPRRLDRFPEQGALVTAATPDEVCAAASRALRGRFRFAPRFRVDAIVEANDPAGASVRSVSAERGYLRETGNLVFHVALLGVLVSVATGQMLHYRGQAIVVEGRGFANAQLAYDTFEHGAAFQSSTLVPFSVTLDRFTSAFDPETTLSRDFLAEVTVREPGVAARKATIKVNHPLGVGGANVYLQGNGYAPDVVVHDADGNVAFTGAVPFLPRDNVYTSRGVIKVPDVTSGKQIGLVGDLLPTAVEGPAGFWRSIFPLPSNPLLVLSVWTGDLGLDSGVPQNVYQLREKDMTQVLDAAGKPARLVLRPGETVDLPSGLGTITFAALPRFVAFDLRHDPALGAILFFALAALAGLAVSLFTPRRRVWVRATAGEDGRTVVRAAALARGDDAGLGAELEAVLDAVRAACGSIDEGPEHSAPAGADEGER